LRPKGLLNSAAMLNLKTPATTTTINPQHQQQLSPFQQTINNNLNQQNRQIPSDFILQTSVPITNLIITPKKTVATVANAMHIPPFNKTGIIFKIYS
jgi:hypothetical protein